MKKLILIALLITGTCMPKEDEPKPTYTYTLLREAKDLGRTVLAMVIVCNGAYYLTGYSPVQEVARFTGRSVVSNSKELAKGFILGVGDGIYDLGAEALEFVGL